MVGNYQHADCSFFLNNEVTVLFIIIFGALSFRIILSVSSIIKGNYTECECYKISVQLFVV